MFAAASLFAAGACRFRFTDNPRVLPLNEKRQVVTGLPTDVESQLAENVILVASGKIEVIPRRSRLPAKQGGSDGMKFPARRSHDSPLPAEQCAMTLRSSRRAAESCPY